MNVVDRAKEATQPYLVTPVSPVASATQPVELIEHRTEQSERDRLELYQRRFRQVARLLFFAYLAFSIRDSLSSPAPWQEPQQRMLFLATIVQLGLVLAGRSRLVQVSWGRFALEATQLATAGLLINCLQYSHFRDVTSYAVYWQSHSRDAQVLVANTWMINWVALIVGYSVAIPRAWRQTVGVALVMCLNPIAVTMIAVLTVPEFASFDRKYLYIQYVIWTVVTVVLAGFASAQTNRLRDEVQQARTFGQYLLKEKIGEGGMGVVYLAEHRLLKRPCVIKQIRQDRATDQKLIARFEREVKLLATLTNWHTVEVFDYGRTSDGHFYYVMEYLPGLDLEELVKREGPIPGESAAYLLAQVCEGLHEAHSIGLIHRDIKPNNVIVGPRGGRQDVAKLLDFGLVQGPFDDVSGDGGRITREGMVVGSVNYMSPEQARGEALDARSDIYSLGITLFFLIEGQPPFPRKTLLETLAAHLNEPVPALKHSISEELKAVLLRCLAKQVQDRFADVQELRHALLRCASASNA